MDTGDFTLQNPGAVAGGQAGGQPVGGDTNQQQTQPVTEAIDFDLGFDNFTEETPNILQEEKKENIIPSNSVADDDFVINLTDEEMGNSVDPIQVQEEIPMQEMGENQTFSYEEPVEQIVEQPVTPVMQEEIPMQEIGENQTFSYEEPVEQIVEQPVTPIKQEEIPMQEMGENQTFSYEEPVEQIVEQPAAPVMQEEIQMQEMGENQTFSYEEPVEQPVTPVMQEEIPMQEVAPMQEEIMNNVPIETQNAGESFSFVTEENNETVNSNITPVTENETTFSPENEAMINPPSLDQLNLSELSGDTLNALAEGSINNGSSQVTPQMDPSQISSLLGDDPLGMLNAPVIENTNPTTEIQMGTQQLIQQNPPMESNQILQTQNSINSTMIPQQIPSNGYEPTLESLNQTVQVLQSQKGPQAGFVNQEIGTQEVLSENKVGVQFDLNQMASQSLGNPEQPLPQNPQMINSPQLLQSPQSGTIDSNPLLQGNGGTISLDQLGTMSFEPNLQTQTQNPNNSQVQTSTDSVKGTGSKGMVIAFLALLPVVGVVIYFMMPDLFAPITEPQIPVQQEMQLPKDNSEIDEENEMKEDDEVDSEHGSAEEDEEKGEEKSEGEEGDEEGEEEGEEESISGGYEEIQEISDEFFGKEVEESEPFQGNEEENSEIEELSPEQKTEIKKTLQKYKKQGEQRLETAKKENDQTVIKYATFITSQTQNFLDEFDKNGTIDMNKYETSLKIMKSYLEKIDKHLNGE